MSHELSMSATTSTESATVFSGMLDVPWISMARNMLMSSSYHSYSGITLSSTPMTGIFPGMCEADGEVYVVSVEHETFRGG